MVEFSTKWLPVTPSWSLRALHGWSRSISGLLLLFEAVDGLVLLVPRARGRLVSVESLWLVLLVHSSLELTLELGRLVADDVEQGTGATSDLLVSVPDALLDILL
ncbi:hypothetical protein PI124_g20494 [Phytophthora idaei]|nr:hypothetical protein PI125_g24762 [Phytophthora idaei]KAG3125726.1 hypothetical protein PI126_g22636 [Phytophthora idaei]KAG3234451.1 hypothetical protein PI124_g20494 [Phytophthora idaei]